MAKVLTEPAHLTGSMGWPWHRHCHTSTPGSQADAHTHQKASLCSTKPQPSSRANQTEPPSVPALFLPWGSVLPCAPYIHERELQSRGPDHRLAMQLDFNLCSPAGQSWSFPHSQASNGGSRYCQVHIPVSVNGVWVPGHWVRRKP